MGEAARNPQLAPIFTAQFNDDVPTECWTATTNVDGANTPAQHTY